MNDAKLLGRFTRDPELRKSSNGNDCLHFTLAVRRRYRKSKDGKPPGQKTDFVPFVAWAGLARTIAEKFHKGERIIIKGPIESNTFTAEDGNRKYIIQVRVEDFEFVDPMPKENVPEQAASEFGGTPVSDEEMNIF